MTYFRNISLASITTLVLIVISESQNSVQGLQDSSSKFRRRSVVELSPSQLLIPSLTDIASDTIGVNQNVKPEKIASAPANVLGEPLIDSGNVDMKSISLELTSKQEGVSSWEPTWESLDTRPLPAWYDQSKIGIFIHWGIFSVPAFRTEWFWYNWKQRNASTFVDFMKKNYPPNFSYADFGPMFTTEFYNASQWAELFEKSGAKYVVLTSKHHEGYTLWPSKYSFSWNSMDVGAHRDLLGELATAIRANTTLKFGLYHSLYEWFNPLWLADVANNHTTDDFVKFKTLPELYELVNTYQPEVIWSDGEWEASADYWKSKEFLAWLYNESPVKDTVVTNDRWGGDTLCKHGGYYTCADRFNPGILQPKKWENCMTLDLGSWGYRRNAKFTEYLSPRHLMKILIETVACGGNLLVNVGPTKEGTIVPIQEERLLQMGEWLKVNGEAIYSTQPWTVQNDTLAPGVWYTTRPDLNRVYALLTIWPIGGLIQLASVNSSIVDSIQVLGAQGVECKWSQIGPGIQIIIPPLDTINSQWAWTIVINIK